MKQILINALLVLMVCLFSNGCGHGIDRPEADRLAQAGLERYSKDEGLTLTKFSTAGVVDHGNVWLYRYTYDGNPRQLVSIIVNKDGRTEVTRMFEERNQP